MKIKILVFLIIILTPIFVFPQWEVRNLGTSAFLSSVFFIDDQTGWVVYTDSCLRTTNGGQNWEKIFVGSDNRQLYDVAFMNNLFGIATSSGGMVYRTFNGGNSWAPKNTLTGSYSYFGIAYLEDTGSHTWIVGTSGIIAYSDNGGDSWTIQENGSFSLNDVFFINKDNGWTVGNNGTILNTSNGGISNGWNPQQSNTSEDLFGVWFINNLVGWAVGDNGVLLKTENGGQNWQLQLTNVNNALIKVSFSDSQNGVIIGSGGIILHTLNGGLDWVNESGIVNTILSDVHYINLENCWVIGNNGKILYSQGSVSIDSISGGGSFEEGTQQTITWKSTYTNNVRIDLSTDNGNNWTHIVTNLTSALSGIYTWQQVPNLPSTQCKLRVQSLKDSQVESISQPFEIFQKTLQLTAPATGASLVGGGPFTITWIPHEEVNIVRLMFREHPDSTAVLITEIPASSLQYDWQVSEVNSDHCQIIIAELDGSPKDSTGFFTIEFDNEKPNISIDTSSINPQKGEALDIVVTITDDTTTTNTLFFRQGGDKIFSGTAPLNSLGNDRYQATIPAISGDFSINERGLEFYIKSVDQLPIPNTAISDTIYRPVSLDSMNHIIQSSQPGSNGIYQMISLRYSLENSNIKSVIEDDFGSYNIKKWRMWFWNAEVQEYGELNDVMLFERGKSFWIASVNSGFTSDAGQSYSLQNFNITLQPGYNQFGHSFAFPVSVEDILDATADITDIDTIWSYNDKWEMASALESGKGYFVKNKGNVNKTLTIPPISSSVSISSIPKIHFQTDGWEIQLRVQSKSFIDDFNFVGTCTKSKFHWDKLDHSEPPPVIGKYISLYFPHKEWKKYPDNYTTDFRPGLTDGAIWKFEVRTNIENSVAKIIFKGIESVPAEYEVYVLDELLKISQNLRNDPVFTFPSVTVPFKKQLKLIVGNEDFLRNNNLGINEIPFNFVLHQNFPNPFNLSTTIRYGLPTQSNVTLKIFNALGEEVAVLLKNKSTDAGYHIHMWNGLNKYGLEISSGIYFYRIETESFSQTKKMIITK